MTPEETFKELLMWELKESFHEQKAAEARTQQAILIGQLSLEGVYLFPPLDADGKPIKEDYSA